MSSSESSESSNLESPQSYNMESPFNSPSQQVPQLANFLTELSCVDNNYVHADNGTRPFLRIIEQPQNHFRFRYKSEMVGTHGCLLGKSYATNKTKTHPTVELVNYKGRALIRCHLAQHNNSQEHPHKLLEDDQDRDVSAEVPDQDSYKVAFPGMGIIHTAKKDVPGLLYKTFVEKSKNSSFNAREIRMQCENLAKSINLNIVRLKFSAHDVVTDREICPPVFSEPIHNMKSAATNDLKICRISRCYGRPRGGDDVYLLVEKVNKKNISIRFYELAEDGKERWSATGHFLQSDVHHQYAIVFRTPQFRDPEITSDVKVYIELVRPSDGRTSEPKEFTYRAEQVFKQSKKRKANSTFSSFNSSSGGSIKSVNDLPATVEMISQNNNINYNNCKDELMNENPLYNHIPQIIQNPNNNDPMGDALYVMASESNPGESQVYMSPVLSQPNVPDPITFRLPSADFEQLLQDNQMLSEEKRRFCETDLTEYFRSYGEDLPDEQNGPDYINSMEFIRSAMIADSGRAKVVENTQSKSHYQNKNAALFQDINKAPTIVDKIKGNDKYSANYKPEDGMEVKKLIKELCELLKNQTGYKKQVVRSKLERLFEIRLSNGDTFLHMTLCSNLSSMEYIVKVIHSVKMPQLLNLTNHQLQTILHLAVINDLPKTVSFLVAKGCNPMVEDKEGNNAIHYAVICQSCLEPLLDAIERNRVSCDLNAYNNEKQTALHLAAVYGWQRSARLLLQRGASYNARDADGRTPLHLAAYDDCLPVMKVLLDFVHSNDVDAVDGRGNTALQIVCGGEVRNNSLEMVKLLLEKKADPMTHEDHNDPAWKLARDKPQIRAILDECSSVHFMCDDDIKSEPEDNYESADEGVESEWQESCLGGLPLYGREVCAALDASGAWRALAARLRYDALLNWYENTSSPTRTLLNQVKECDEIITSKSLAMILEDMGQTEVANIIRRYVTD